MNNLYLIWRLFKSIPESVLISLGFSTLEVCFIDSNRCVTNYMRLVHFNTSYSSKLSEMLIDCFLTFHFIFSLLLIFILGIIFSCVLSNNWTILFFLDVCSSISNKWPLCLHCISIFSIHCSRLLRLRCLISSMLIVSVFIFATVSTSNAAHRNICKVWNLKF